MKRWMKNDELKLVFIYKGKIHSALKIGEIFYKNKYSLCSFSFNGMQRGLKFVSENNFTKVEKLLEFNACG
jgi:hypothetical protein